MKKLRHCHSMYSRFYLIYVSVPVMAITDCNVKLSLVIYSSPQINVRFKSLYI